MTVVMVSMVMASLSSSGWIEKINWDDNWSQICGIMMSLWSNQSLIKFAKSMVKILEL